MSTMHLVPKTNRAHLILAAMLALTLLVVTTGLALAHERRAVGKYDLVVGFLNEPAYANQVNAIDFRVTNHETTKPMEGLEKTVNAEVIVGGKTMPVKLATRFGQPGAYAGYFIPTRPGTFIFHFTGEIEGQKLDEKFESGPGRFSDVEDTSALQFPERIPDGLTAAAQIQTAQSSANSAQTVGYIGIAFGAIGILIGALALRRGK
jgi:hypothetical protein